MRSTLELPAWPSTLADEHLRGDVALADAAGREAFMPLWRPDGVPLRRLTVAPAQEAAPHAAPSCRPRRPAR